MRGILSFLLVMLLAEFLVVIYTYYNAEIKSSYYLEEQTNHLQKFYDKKIKIKRGIQNVLTTPTRETEPYKKIEEVAQRLENFESIVEQDNEYKIDIWCGYIATPSLDFMLESAKAGLSTKPPLVFEPHDKVVIRVRGVGVEMHACSSVIVVDQVTGRINIGRGNLETTEDLSVLMPAIGITIADKEHEIYDVDILRNIQVR
ncbi:MAG: hypothetical protein QXS93_00160 [Candidatus Micrarchaeia archaeon]